MINLILISHFEIDRYKAQGCEKGLTDLVSQTKALLQLGPIFAFPWLCSFFNISTKFEFREGFDLCITSNLCYWCRQISNFASSIYDALAYKLWQLIVQPHAKETWNTRSIIKVKSWDHNRRKRKKVKTLMFWETSCLRTAMVGPILSAKNH